MRPIEWQEIYGAVFRTKQEDLHPVRVLDGIPLECLVGIEEQKRQILENTERFVQGLPSNHALLWGARGTGKSSLIKAVFAHFKEQDLRIIQIYKSDLAWLPEIIDGIREEPYRFILFCDDLAFESDDDAYKGLKSVLEGGIEAPAENVLIYATSNRRHLLPEYRHENQAEVLDNGEIHFGDSVEEKISLSDRFGLWVSFYQGTMQDYLRIVDVYFEDFRGDREKLHKEAEAFSKIRASRSGRTAYQFWRHASAN